MTQKTLQITFHNLAHSEAVETAIRKRFSKITELEPGLVGCRIVVESPHNSHRHGNHFLVKADLSSCGYELVVDKDGAGDVHEDVFSAVKDTFDTLEKRILHYRSKRREISTRDHGRSPNEDRSFSPVLGS